MLYLCKDKGVLMVSVVGVQSKSLGWGVDIEFMVLVVKLFLLVPTIILCFFSEVFVTNAT